MPEAQNRQSNFLSHERFRFTLKATGLMVLPPYKGGVFHSAFGNAFKNVVCAVQRAECGNCILRTQCLYAAFFEPSAPSEHPDAAKFSPAPPPYVLNPPLDNRQAFHPGRTLDFDLVLMGRAIDALPYFVFSFIEMGRRGLGRDRGNYLLERVDLLRDTRNIQVYDGAKDILNAFPPKEETSLNPKSKPVNALTLRFTTPLRLKVKGKLITKNELTFPLFFERLTQRIALLNAFYGSNGNMPDLSPLISKAKKIKMVSNELHWYDWERYSARQKRAMRLGGLKGQIKLNGELDSFMPWLKLGESLNVGQGTSFGLGRFKIFSACFFN